MIVDGSCCRVETVRDVCHSGWGGGDDSEEGEGSALLLTSMGNAFGDFLSNKCMKSPEIALNYSYFSVPQLGRVISQVGTMFMSVSLKQLYELLWIKSICTSVCHQQTDDW